MLRTPKPSTFETNDNGQRETIMTSAAKAANSGNTVHDYDGHDLNGFELESGPQAFDRLEPSLNQINQNLGQLQQTIMANYRKPIRPFRMLNDNQSE
ncbi:hypothetical protein HDE_13333 [Halotydeus destructor]|nr:hypothetical protein HDE_13333 [Halotydeus destructor]